MRYQPLSIKKEGLDRYLERTSKQHNGLGYSEFLKLIEAKVNLTNLAKAFKVNRVTITKWLHIHEEELAKIEHETALDELHEV